MYRRTYYESIKIGKMKSGNRSQKRWQQNSKPCVSLEIQDGKDGQVHAFNTMGTHNHNTQHTRARTHTRRKRETDVSKIRTIASTLLSLETGFKLRIQIQVRTTTVKVLFFWVFSFVYQDQVMMIWYCRLYAAQHHQPGRGKTVFITRILVIYRT